MWVGREVKVISMQVPNQQRHPHPSLRRQQSFDVFSFKEHKFCCLRRILLGLGSIYDVLKAFAALLVARFYAMRSQ